MKIQINQTVMLNLSRQFKDNTTLLFCTTPHSCSQGPKGAKPPNPCKLLHNVQQSSLLLPLAIQLPLAYSSWDKPQSFSVRPARDNIHIHIHIPNIHTYHIPETPSAYFAFNKMFMLLITHFKSNNSLLFLSAHFICPYMPSRLQPVLDYYNLSLFRPIYCGLGA